jgi:hypothetical protein
MSGQESHLKVEGFSTYENFFDENDEFSVIDDQSEDIDLNDNLLSDNENGFCPESNHSF